LWITRKAYKKTSTIHNADLDGGAKPPRVSNGVLSTPSVLSNKLNEETNMGKINLIISDKLEKEFREAIFKKYGMKRGNLSKAVEESIKEWIKKQS
jgi:hypothetical protein